VKKTDELLPVFEGGVLRDSFINIYVELYGMIQKKGYKFGKLI
jgi:hypothetical protein